MCWSIASHSQCSVTFAFYEVWRPDVLGRRPGFVTGCVPNPALTLELVEQIAEDGVAIDLLEHQTIATRERWSRQTGTKCAPLS